MQSHHAKKIPRLFVLSLWALYCPVARCKVAHHLSCRNMWPISENIWNMALQFAGRGYEFRINATHWMHTRINVYSCVAIPLKISCFAHNLNPQVIVWVRLVRNCLEMASKFFYSMSHFETNTSHSFVNRLSVWKFCRHGHNFISLSSPPPLTNRRRSSNHPLLHFE